MISISLKKARNVKSGPRLKLWIQAIDVSTAHRLTASASKITSSLRISLTWPPSIKVGRRDNRNKWKSSLVTIKQHPICHGSYQVGKTSSTKTVLLCKIGQYVASIRSVICRLTLQLALVQHRVLIFSFASL